MKTIFINSCFLIFIVIDPSNEKVHQIIARTAMFVSKHGGQSEIILRVKQGDNPTFGFLMPNHHLHAYFRFLVDHQELLKPGIDDDNSSGDKNDNQGLNQSSGALSLLGSVYGSGDDDDDDGTPGKTPELKRNECEEAVSEVKTSSQGTEHAESSPDGVKKDGSTSKNSITTSKEKVPVIKRNHSINTVKAATSAKPKKFDALGSQSNAADKSLTPFPSKTKIEKPIVEPPSNLKRVIEKIVEFIIKNGKEFESVLAEQDHAHGRFPFLLPSDQYHPYYMKVLQDAQEPKSLGKGFLPEKHDPVGRTGDKRSASHKESDNLSVGSMGSDLPYGNDRKEKFKMVINKSNIDGQEPTPRDSRPPMGVSMDAAAAAAILQAATRGIKNPSLEFLTKSSSGNGQGLGSDGGYLSGLGSLLSSQPLSSVQKSKQNAESSVSVPVAKVIAETAAIAAAGEADSSEASMSKEQKLKAERLKRAKMFAAMIKSGSAPVKSEPRRGISAEPPGSGISGSGAETGNLVGKEREGSSVPHEVDNSDKSLKSDEKLFADNTERRSKRKYRSRSHRDEEEEKEDKRSRRKHRSHRSSHGSRDRHKHKRRHSSSKDRDDKRAKHDSSSDDESHHSRDYYKYDSSCDEKHHSSRRQHRESNSSDDEHRHSRHRHRGYSSSDGEHRHRHRTRKHRSRSRADSGRDLEEGEINMKRDQSRASEDGCGGREASGDPSKSYLGSREPSQPSETTDVSDELRAKIRAMLMATL